MRSFQVGHPRVRFSFGSVRLMTGWGSGLGETVRQSLVVHVKEVET